MDLQGRDLKITLQGDDVRLLQSELLQLGFAIPEIELHNAVFGSGTREAVLRFQDMNRLESTGIVDERTARAINAAVEASIYTVMGTVVSPDRAGVGGLRVQLVDKNVGQDIPLFEAVTDDRGHYDARFTGQSLRERGKSQPDLQARVYMGEVFLAASDIYYNATNYETLNVTLPANAAALPSEHETLTSAIEPHYGGSLRDLEESGDRQDITYLVTASLFPAAIRS